MSVFKLEGVISAYDGSYTLGIFDTLENAIQGRKDYRQRLADTNTLSSDFESYEIYEFELNALAPNEYASQQPVDNFVPNRGKRRGPME